MLDNLSELQTYQLGLLDEYLRFVGLEEIERITNEAKTVAKLKDSSTEPSVLIGLTDYLQFQQSKIHTMESNMYTMEGHIKELTQSLHALLQSQRIAISDAESKMFSVKSYNGLY